MPLRRSLSACPKCLTSPLKGTVGGNSHHRYIDCAACGARVVVKNEHKKRNRPAAPLAAESPLPPDLRAPGPPRAAADAPPCAWSPLAAGHWLALAVPA